MGTTNRAAAGLAGLGLSALAMQALAAPSASADVTAIARTCNGGMTCTIDVSTGGTTMLSPVTISQGGTTIATVTPTASNVAGQAVASISWTAPAPGEYWITATQGTSTATVPVAVCTYTGWLPQGCTLVAGFVNGGASGSASLPESLGSAILFPLSAR